MLSMLDICRVCVTVGKLLCWGNTVEEPVKGIPQQGLTQENWLIF